MRVLIKRVNITEVEVADESELNALKKAFKSGDIDVVEYCAEHGLSGESTYTVKIK